MKIQQIIRIYKNFGLNIVFPAICASSFKNAVKWKHKCVIKYLKEKYIDLILEYKNKKNDSINNNRLSSGTIWTMWWQGESSLPEIVRLCHASVNKYRGSHKFKVITKDNYQEYIALPEYALKKISPDGITITHLSDIIRVYLLSQYGGLWLDSTVFLADKIPEEVFNSEYYTIRRDANTYSRNISEGKWTGFFQAAKRRNVLCSFVSDFLLEYWKNHNYIIDYFLIDYAIAIAYEELPECKKLLESVPINNINVHRLNSLMSSDWNPVAYEKLTNNTRFFKLTWKEEYKKIISGHETFYGHLTKTLLV